MKFDAFSISAMMGLLKHQGACVRGMSRPKRATLVDVARAAGVGPMTVSRTLSGHEYVAQATAKRVLAAIRRLDYRPNHAARILGGQLSRSIGLIVPDIADSFFSIVSHAVQEAAREQGYLVWLAASNEDPVIESAQIEMMTHHPVDGILLVPTDSGDPYLKKAIVGVVPIVAIDRPVAVNQAVSVMVENKRGAVMAVEHLVCHGRRRIACIATNAHLRPIIDRIAGYDKGCRAAHLRYKKTLLLDDRDSATSMIAEIFASEPRPDAIFAANNMATIWVIEALRSLKLNMGKDIALIGFDDVNFFALLTPTITAIRQPAEELGRLAALLLLEKIKGVRSSYPKTVLPVSLILRESCGCPQQHPPP